MGVQPSFSPFQFPQSRPVSCQTGDRPPGPSAGFTILEVLVAMVVASIMVMIITPPVFLVTAARVQQRRAQQSLQLAQAEIDRVRTTVERPTDRLAPDTDTALLSHGYATVTVITTVQEVSSPLDLTGLLPGPASDGAGGTDRTPANSRPQVVA